MPRTPTQTQQSLMQRIVAAIYAIVDALHPVVDEIEARSDIRWPNRTTLARRFITIMQELLALTARINPATLSPNPTFRTRPLENSARNWTAPDPTIEHRQRTWRFPFPTPPGQTLTRPTDTADKSSRPTDTADKSSRPTDHPGDRPRVHPDDRPFRGPARPLRAREVARRLAILLHELARLAAEAGAILGARIRQNAALAQTLIGCQALPKTQRTWERTN